MQGLPQNGPVFGFGTTPMGSGLLAQPLHQIVFNATYQQIGHDSSLSKKR
jgi:hypothetical protein